MDRAERDELIRQYEAAPADVRALVEPLTDDELDRRPPPDVDPDGWTPRQVVHHLADSEMTSAIRLRKLLAEDDAVIAGYDENAFAQRLRYDTRPIGPSLDALAAARATTAQLLHDLTDDEWTRMGTHTESGPYGVETWLRIYAAHGREHADQIRRALGERYESSTSR